MCLPLNPKDMTYSEAEQIVSEIEVGDVITDKQYNAIEIVLMVMETNNELFRKAMNAAKEAKKIKEN